MIDLASEAWANALRLGLSAEVAYTGTPPNAKSSSLTIFKLGPVRVGYADFTAGVSSATLDYQRATIEAAKQNRVDVVRFQAPEAANASLPYARFTLNTAIIQDLQSWDERALEKPKRTANRVSRTDIEIRTGERSDSTKIHQLYANTIARHGGRRRYTPRYFAEIATSSSWVATLKNEVVAFVASGKIHDRGLYLHGGHSEIARNHYASDLLFLAMIREAKLNGLSSFDFLASPPRQTSLLRYKRCWGATVSEIVVSDVPLRIRGALFSTLYKMSAVLKRR